MYSLSSLLLLTASAWAGAPEGFPGAKVSFQQLSADGMSCQLVATNRRTCSGSFPATLTGVPTKFTVTVVGGDLNSLDILDATLTLDALFDVESEGVVKARALKSILSDMYKSAGCTISGIDPQTNAITLADGSVPGVFYVVGGTWSSKTHKISVTISKEYEGE